MVLNSRKKTSVENLLRGDNLLELRAVREIAECDKEEARECTEGQTSKGVTNGIIISF
jgi:hypothetical protein